MIFKLDVEGVDYLMGSVKELSPKEFRKMQLLQLDMIEELDRVCRKNHINYAISCGTLLGAVRHKGYIPWDDDADIVMLRDEYERFKEVAGELNAEICFFQDHSTDPEYRWGYGKLRRTGTTYIKAGQEHIKCKTGVFIDIFPLDDVPKNLIGQMIQDFYCFCLRKILWSEVGKYSKDSNIIIKSWYHLLSHIPSDYVFKRINGMVRKSTRDPERKVRLLMFTAFGKLYIKNPLKKRYAMPKKWFLELDEYDFEGKKFYGTKDYDAILSYIYGDYMVLPPVEQRQQRAIVSDYDLNC